MIWITTDCPACEGTGLIKKDEPCDYCLKGKVKEPICENNEEQEMSYCLS